MASILAALKDKRKRALSAARFRAWWEGEEFDEASALAAIEEAEKAAAAPSEENGGEKSAAPDAKGPDATEAALFDTAAPPVSPRLVALQKIWGSGRIMPGDAAAEALHPARLGIAEDGALAILGAGLEAPVLALGEAHKGKCVALEWREETRASLGAHMQRAAIASRVDMRAVDLDAFAAESEAFDGLISFDEFTYVADAGDFARRLAGALKPGACAVIEAYAAIPSPAFAPAFATAFAEPHLRPAGDLIEALEQAGLAIEANEDHGEEHIAWIKAGFKRLGEVLGAVADAPVEVQALQEIAWEASAWRSRAKLLTQRRLERRQIVARKRG